ncbi:hypothetical protein pb186bvf_011937 [Paramecium bursaria]
MSLIEINDDYIFLKNAQNLIGKGGFGTVYKCQSKKNPQLKLCIKVYDLEQCNLPLQKQLCQESQVIESLEQASHMNLIQIYHRGYFNNANNYCIIMDMCSCDLQNYLSERKIQQNPFKEVEVISFIKQISNGYKALLARKIIHRDIKPANILVNIYHKNNDPNNFTLYYKIADLDCSKIYKQMSTSINKGTWLYCSPESDQPRPQTEQSDIFSFGCTLYYILYGKHFKIRKENQVGLKKYSDYIDNTFDKLIGFSPNVEQAVIEFIKSCLEKDMEKRIQWLDIFQWKLIKDFQIDYSQTFDSLIIDQKQIYNLNLNLNQNQKLKDRSQRLKKYFTLLKYKINVTYYTINLLTNYKISITEIFIIGLLNLMKQYYNLQLGLISDKQDIIPKFLIKNKRYNFPKDDIILYVTEQMKKKNVIQGETALKERIIELEERIMQISLNSKDCFDSAQQLILNEKNKDPTQNLNDLLRECQQADNILQILEQICDKYLLCVLNDEKIIQIHNNFEIQHEIIKNIQIILDFETKYDQIKYNEVVITKEELERIKHYAI